jgi:hypothetical protein
MHIHIFVGLKSGNTNSAAHIHSSSVSISGIDSRPKDPRLTTAAKTVRVSRQALFLAPRDPDPQDQLVPSKVQKDHRPILVADRIVAPIRVVHLRPSAESFETPKPARSRSNIRFPAPQKRIVLLPLLWA